MCVGGGGGGGHSTVSEKSREGPGDEANTTSPIKLKSQYCIYTVIDIHCLQGAQNQGCM